MGGPCTVPAPQPLLLNSDLNTVQPPAGRHLPACLDYSRNPRQLRTVDIS